MGKYKDKHGTTRVGDFLREIDLGKSLKVVANLTQGNIDGAIDVITNSESLSAEDKAFALQVMELDIQEMKGVSSRWDSDMKSDSYLSKNVRPLSLIFLTLATVVLIYLDSFDQSITVPNEWIDLLKSLLLGIYIAYFGSRGMEKYRTISNN